MLVNGEPICKLMDLAVAGDMGGSEIHALLELRSGIGCGWLELSRKKRIPKAIPAALVLRPGPVGFVGRFQGGDLLQ